MFKGPLMCRMSLQNSAMNDRCLVCRGDLSVEEAKAKVSGLWSVLMKNFLPSKKWRKCFTDRKIASSSLSNAEYLRSAGVRKWE